MNEEIKELKETVRALNFAISAIMNQVCTVDEQNAIMELINKRISKDE